MTNRLRLTIDDLRLAEMPQAIHTAMHHITPRHRHSPTIANRKSTIDNHLSLEVPHG
jgi:hypothetical protein